MRTTVLSSYTLCPENPSGLNKGHLNSSNGYYYTFLPKRDGKKQRAGCHRVVYCLANNLTLDDIKGKLVDHIDGNKVNNHIENLRLCTAKENNNNRGRHREGRLVGASLAKDKVNFPKPWKAYFCVGDKVHHVGHYATEIEAHEAHKKAANAYYQVK